MGDWRLAVDIGGTFTDVVLLNADGRIVIDKTLTTPSNPLEGVRRAISEVMGKADIAPRDIGGPIVHATTLVTNSLIEGKTARAALVTTRGFADVLLIRNEHRYDMYDLQIEFPDPLIPRERTFEVNERTTAGGGILVEPTDTEIEALAAELRRADVESVAICFLHAYANPSNERALQSELAARLTVPICVSSQIAPQIREYPRTVTTICNAATMPLVSRYLDDLQRWLAAEGFGASLLIMLSNGGLVSPDIAAREPVRMVESGPAAGALAASWQARRTQKSRLLSFDMGGTTAKSCLIEDFQPALTPDFEIARMYRFKKGSGFPVLVPSVDLVEIGAGGGSIARIDELGLMKVGPESAGADPGPACYGRSGSEPTVTDADLLLGFLDADYFLGGDMSLDVEAAEQAVGKLAAILGTSTIDTAAGIYELVNQYMAAATRMHAVERGVDLRGVQLVAFGGAGPVHACGVAELLDSTQIVFPANASVLSAFGALVTPVRIDLARSHVATFVDVTQDEREELLDEMRAEGRRVAAAAGIALESLHFRYGLDARYIGQGNEITLWIGEGDTWPLSDDETLRRFADEYQRIYGLSIPDVGVEAVTWRVVVSAPVSDVDLRIPPISVALPRPQTVRSVHFSRREPPAQAPVYRREELGVGAVVVGPALVQERETTAVLSPGWRAEVTADASLVAVREGT